MGVDPDSAFAEHRGEVWRYINSILGCIFFTKLDINFSLNLAYYSELLDANGY